MMGQDEFDAWCERLDLSDEAIAVVADIRASAPARRVASTHTSAATRYYSDKMGWALGTESRTIELPVACDMDNDDDIIEYYDQPPKIWLSYRSPTGRKMAPIETTLDFFEIGRDWGGWIECKPEEKLVELAAHNPNHYRRGPNGRWCCPPGDDYAAKLGLRFRVISSTDIDRAYQRNLDFMEAYLRKRDKTVADAAATEILGLMDKGGAAPLSELLDNVRMATADDIYTLMAARRLHVDMRGAPLAEPRRVWVFRSAAMARAHAFVHGQPIGPPDVMPVVRIRVGEEIDWDGATWTIASAGRATGKIGLVRTGDEGRGEALMVDRSGIESLVRQGLITGILERRQCEAEREAQDLVARATDEEIDDALKKSRIVLAHREGTGEGEDRVPETTRYYWARRWDNALDKYGRRYAFVGLLSGLRRSGNRGAKHPPIVVALADGFGSTVGQPEAERGEDLDKLAEEHVLRFERPDGGSRLALWGALCTACKDKGLQPMSYETFCDRIRKRPAHAQTKGRRGSRAAYKHEPQYLELEDATPRHGDRPWQVGHIDHSVGGVELFCPKTGKNLGTCWITFLVDAYSRRILAIYIAFCPPSYVSCMMVLRECVRRHGRLPETIVVDGGPEFRSVTFERLIARYEKHKRTRPTSKPRHGSVCERLFGTTMTQLIQHMEGNTEVRRYIRQVTKGVDPKRRGCWTLGALYHHLCGWAYEVYDVAEHRGILQSPRAAYEEGMRTGGEREHLMIPYDKDFIMATLPSTPKGTAKVQGTSGVKVGHIYYWTIDETFREPGVAGTSVKVRRDPFDAGHIYAYVRGEWRECAARYHYAAFRGRPIHEVEMASEELRRRHEIVNGRGIYQVTAECLAEYLLGVKATETELARLRAAEDRGVVATVMGGIAGMDDAGGPLPIAEDPATGLSSLGDRPARRHAAAPEGGHEGGDDGAEGNDEDDDNDDDDDDDDVCEVYA